MHGCVVKQLEQRLNNPDHKVFITMSVTSAVKIAALTVSVWAAVMSYARHGHVLTGVSPERALMAGSA